MRYPRYTKETDHPMLSVRCSFDGSIDYATRRTLISVVRRQDNSILRLPTRSSVGCLGRAGRKTDGGLRMERRMLIY